MLLCASVALVRPNFMDAYVVMHGSIRHGLCGLFQAQLEGLSNDVVARLMALAADGKLPDSDGDRIPDCADLDADGNGVPDHAEPGQNMTGQDSDSDGKPSIPPCC